MYAGLRAVSSGLRLRRPVFFAAGLRCPVCLRRIALCPVFLPVFRLSLAGPHLPLPVSPSVRVSLSPHLASFVGPSSFVCIPSGFSSVISCFSVHRPSLAACCPSPVAPSIVHRPPLVGGCPYPVARPAAPLSAAVRSGPRLLYPRNPGLRVCGSCLPCRSAAVPSVCLSAKMRPSSVPWSPRRF